MLRISRYVRILLFLCAVFTIVYGLLTVFAQRFGATVSPAQRETLLAKASMVSLRERNFTDEQINRMTLLGRWLLSPEGTLPPSIINVEKDRYLILIWNHGEFLERRHIKRFTNEAFSPWDDCTVKNCELSYKSEDLNKADAVVFHLHMTRSPLELPVRTRADQRWIFLTDESPLHTFLYGSTKLSEYNGLFNWSMSYRMDSDVPVPYGRAIRASLGNSSKQNFQTDSIKQLKTKLVAVMGSNCANNNGRWEYVGELKSFLGDDLDIYGKCLNGNVTACPGHFHRDCSALDAYKFYLAFENSNCAEYLTEKVFWHGYRKLAVPIIMGAPKKDCERLLPPRSFLHVSDFANPATLASYIKYLSRHDDKYLEFHEWRRRYKVINEHGYFGSASRHYCRICEALNFNSPANKVYDDLESFWSKRRDCTV